MKEPTPRSEWPPIIGKIIDIKMKEIDVTEINQPGDLSTQEMIDEIKERFKFEDDKTQMVEMIDNLLKSRGNV